MTLDGKMIETIYSKALMLQREKKNKTRGTERLNDVSEVTQPFGDAQTRPTRHVCQS